MKTFYFLVFVLCLFLNSNAMAQQVLLYPNNYVYSYPYALNYQYVYPVYPYQTLTPNVVAQEKRCWPFYNRQYYQPRSQYYMNYSHYYYYPTVVPYTNSYEYVPWAPYRY